LYISRRSKISVAYSPLVHLDATATATKLLENQEVRCTKTNYFYYVMLIWKQFISYTVPILNHYYDECIVSHLLILVFESEEVLCSQWTDRPHASSWCLLHKATAWPWTSICRLEHMSSALSRLVFVLTLWLDRPCALFALHQQSHFRVH
jgi:hypothetical protein